MEVEQLRRVLKPMSLTKVARGAGVSVHALRRLMRPDSHPRAEVVHKVTVYLETYATAVANG